MWHVKFNWFNDFSNLDYEKSHLRKVTSGCFAHEALMLNFVDQSSD